MEDLAMANETPDTLKIMQLLHGSACLVCNYVVTTWQLSALKGLFNSAKTTIEATSRLVRLVDDAS